jgi:hypothetical protein
MKERDFLPLLPVLWLRKNKMKQHDNIAMILSSVVIAYMDLEGLSYLILFPTGYRVRPRVHS